MVQFNGPHGKIDFAYLQHGGRHPPADPPSDSFVNKIVVVTGCGSGVGYEAAKKIAGLGPKKLFLGTRTAMKGDIVKKSIIASVPIDPSVLEVIPVEYTSLDSVSQFCDAITRSTHNVDSVLLSAGNLLFTREMTEDGWPVSFVVNVLSPALIALKLLPLLKKTPGSVLEFVSSISYCNASSQDIAPLLEDPSAGALDFFNSEERWTKQRSYCEAKLMLMFVLDGLVHHIGSSDGPLLLACCPGQCKTSLYRGLPLVAKLFMMAYNACIARTAEQGSRTLVTGLLQDKSAHGKLWVNDTLDDRSPGLSKEEWTSVQERVWSETLEVLKKHDPMLGV